MTPLEQFRREGFVIVRGLFTPEALQPVARDLATTFHTRAAALGLSLPAATGQAEFSDLVAGLFSHDVAAYIAAAKLTQHLASVHRMGVSEPLMAAIGALGLDLPAISTRPVIHYMADRLKIPGGYQKTPPHQDWRSVQGSLDGVTVWAPLYDVGADDYPLEIIPRSHLSGLLDSVPDVPNYRIPAPLLDEARFEALALGAGDAVIFSGFLVHRTGERGGDQVRVSFSFRFNNVLEASFADRNYPNPYIYRPDPEIVTPGFADADDVGRIFAGPRP